MKLLVAMVPPHEECPSGIELYTREAAIRIAKAAAAASNYVYESDERALEDFIVVHWAQWVDVTE